MTVRGRRNFRPAAAAVAVRFEKEVEEEEEGMMVLGRKEDLSNGEM